MEESKHIIVAVLNWGMGHATRCEPLIRRCIDAGYKPVIAADGAALDYLHRQFPELATEHLPPYNIRYARRMIWAKMLLQLPRIAVQAGREHRRIEKLVEKYRAVGVISDNRLGCYSKKVTSVYLSHQLKIMLPFGRKLASRVHHYYINHYTQCWVPDWIGEPNLSGELSHHYTPEIPLRYVGPLSRFEGMPLPACSSAFDYCILLSGPEPQRSILEEKLMEGFSKSSAKVVLIRGTRARRDLKYPDHWNILDLANAAQVAKCVRSARMTICRSGYSSIMDFVYLENKALLIPTPGQPEQLYLARFLTSKGLFLYAEQDYLELFKNLKEAEKYRGAAALSKGAVNWRQLLSLFEGKAES